jgi:FkbM family methyltransferase
MYKQYRRRLLKYVPPAWRIRVVEFKNFLWGGWKQIAYSHSGEDLVIDAFFRTTKKGFYVDVGAHHPMRYSNTALLYKRGWKGINIDPDSNLIAAFNRNRKRDVNLNVGVASQESELTLYRFSDPAVNTFVPENAERLRSKRWLTQISDDKIPVQPLSKLLDEYLPENTLIDFLNIDVEDLDLEVIQSNNWEKYRPGVIAIEDRFFNPLHPEQSDIYTFLINKDYIFLGYLGLSLIMVERECMIKNVNKRLS